MSTLVDSNVLLDVVERVTHWSDWSTRQLRTCADEGPVLINQLIFAEASARFAHESEFEETFRFPLLVRDDLPWAAAFLAGSAHQRYRKKGGARERTLPDFLIGAHAAVKGYRLLTRDARRYRAYFPDLDIVAPDTHP